MARSLTLVLLVVGTGLGGGAAPAPPEDDAARMRRVFGAPYEPGRDVTFELTGEKLRITLPGREERSDRDPNLFGATRVWREVRGDFTAVVRVSFLPHMGGRLAGGVGGLVVWSEVGDHLVLGRELGRGTVAVIYTYPGSVRTARAAEPPERRDAVYLRLRREGKTMTAAHGDDGKTWTELIPDETAWGEVVKMGVYAKNWSPEPLAVVFDQYRLTRPKK